MEAAISVLRSTVRAQMAAKALTLPQFVKSLKFTDRETIRRELGKGRITPAEANLATGFIELVEEMEKVEAIPGQTPETAAAGAAELRTPQRKRRR